MIVNRTYLYFAFKIKDAVFIGDFNSPHVILDDKDENINKVYNAILDTVDKGESVLVCSMRGQSRSLTLISAFFMKRYKWTLYKTLEFMNSKRSDFEIRANFLKQLVSFEKRLFGDDLSQCSRTWKDDSNPEPEAEMMKNTFLNSQKQLPFQENPKQKNLTNSMQKQMQKISWSIELAQEMKEDQINKNELKAQAQTSLQKKSILKVKVDKNLTLPSNEDLPNTQETKELKEKDPNLLQLEQYKNEFLTNSLLKSESKTYDQIYKRNMMNLSRESPIHLRKKTNDDTSLPNSQVVDCRQKIVHNESNQQLNNINNSPVLDPNQRSPELQQRQEKTNEQQMRDSRYAKEQIFFNPQNPQNPAMFQIKTNGLSPNLSRNPTPQQQKQNKQYRKSPIPLPFHSRRFMYRNNENNIPGDAISINTNIQQTQNTMPTLSDDQQTQIVNRDQHSLNMTQNIQQNMQTSRFQNNQTPMINNQSQLASNNNSNNNSFRIPIKKMSTEVSEINENDSNKFETIKLNTTQISLPSTNLRTNSNNQNLVTPPINQQSGLNNNNSNFQAVNLTEFNNSSLHQQQNNQTNLSFRNNNMNATKVVNFRKFSVSNNNSPDHKSSTQNNFKNGFQNNLQNYQNNKPPPYSTPKNPQDLNILSSKKKNAFTFYDNGNNNNNTTTNALTSSVIKSPYANFLPSLKDKTQKFTLPKRGIYHHLNQEVSNTEGNSPVNHNSNNLVFTEVTIDGYLNQDFNMNTTGNFQNQEQDQFKFNLQKARNTINSKETPQIQQNHPRDQRSLSMAEQRRTQTESSADTYQHQKKKTIIQSNNTTWLTPKDADPLQKLQNPIKSISIKTYEKKTPKYFKNVLKKDTFFQQQQQQQITNITFS